MKPHPLSLPWQLLAKPAETWRLLADSLRPWPAMFTQALLLFVGWLIAGRAMLEMQASAYGADSAPATMFGGLLLAGLTVTFSLLFAALLWSWFALLGLRQGYRRLLSWTAYGLLPVYLGRTVSLLAVAIVRPLGGSPAESLALQLNPLTLGFAGLFPPLSFPWVLATAVDLFGAWSLVLLWLGARHFLRLTGSRLYLSYAALLLLFVLILTAVWQGLQQGVA